MTQTWDAWGGSWGSSWGYSWGWTDASGKVGGDDAGIGERWKKRDKRKQEDEFDRMRREKLALRKTIELAINPIRETSEAAAVVREANTVEIVPNAGAAISIEVPAAFDAKTVAREVAAALERAQIKARQAAAMAQAQRFMEAARADIAARIRRRRQQQYILLMTD